MTWLNDADVETREQREQREAEAEARKVRLERDRRLAATDYQLMPDYPLTDSERKTVSQYRQRLRDITEQPGFPHRVEWP